MSGRILYVFVLFVFAVSAVFWPSFAGQERHENKPRSQWSYFREMVSTPRTKLNELQTMPSIAASPLDTEDFDRRVGIIGGESIILDSPQTGQVVGSTGAGPCIGLLLVIPTSSGVRLAAYHFTATENPEETLKALDPLPSGTRAALFGGDNTPTSNFTLASVLRFLRKRPAQIHIDGYSNSVGLWVDKWGSYYRFRTDVNSTDDSRGRN